MHPSMRPYRTRWILVLLCGQLLAPALAGAQDPATTLMYLRAVAAYFQLPAGEVSILADWELPPEEIPVALFVASRAGISPEALVALRSSGRSWVELARRYQVEASQLHVPLSSPPGTGPLSSAYSEFGSRSVSEWGRIELSAEDIVTLVNLRVLSAALRLPPDEVLRRRRAARNFVEVYARAVG